MRNRSDDGEPDGRGLSLEALTMFAEAAGQSIFNVPGMSKTTIYRSVKRPSISIWDADRIACKGFGVHPMVIWGDEWLEAISFDLDDNEIGEEPQPEAQTAVHHVPQL